MFRSYEKGRKNYVTFIANYRPFQTPYGGPNYFPLSENYFYDIQIDNDGDANPDIIFSILPNNFYGTKETGGAIKVLANNTKVYIPTKFVNPIVSPFNKKKFTKSFVNFVEQYDVYYSTKANGKGIKKLNKKPYAKPFDNAGTKTFPNYNSYVKEYLKPKNSALPLKGVNGCGAKDQGRVFVGQRRESFSVNLGGIFDLVDFVPLDVSNGLSAFIAQSSTNNVIRTYSITSIVLEVPIKCLITKKRKDPVIGAWTTTRVANGKKKKSPGAQVSRLGHPLVNEVVIGLKYKVLFNTNAPKLDAQFAQFVTNPTLPTILSLLFLNAVNSITNQSLTTLAPTNYPRTDLVATFLTGINGINQPKKVQAAEMLRLNTATPPTIVANQSTYGVLGGDAAGFPNGRRPGDDVVDVSLNVLMGRLCTIPSLGLCSATSASVGGVAFTDGAPVSASDFSSAFPYLNDPLPGNSPEFGQALYSRRRRMI